MTETEMTLELASSIVLQRLASDSHLWFKKSSYTKGKNHVTKLYDDLNCVISTCFSESDDLQVNLALCNLKDQCVHSDFNLNGELEYAKVISSGLCFITVVGVNKLYLTRLMDARHSNTKALVKAPAVYV